MKPRICDVLGGLDTEVYVCVVGNVLSDGVDDAFSTRIDLIFDTMSVSEFDLGLLPTRFTDILFVRH